METEQDPITIPISTITSMSEDKSTINSILDSNGNPAIFPMPDSDDGPAIVPMPESDENSTITPMPESDDNSKVTPMPESDENSTITPMTESDDKPTVTPMPESDGKPTITPMPESDDIPTIAPMPECDDNSIIMPMLESDHKPAILPMPESNDNSTITPTRDSDEKPTITPMPEFDDKPTSLPMPDSDNKPVIISTSESDNEPTVIPMSEDDNKPASQTRTLRSLVKRSLSERDVDTSSVRRSPRLSPLTQESKDRSRSSKKPKTMTTPLSSCSNYKNPQSFFVGDPVPEDEAKQRWPWRYPDKDPTRKRLTKLSDDEDDDLLLEAKCHYYQARIFKQTFDIGDCAYIKGEENGPNYIGRILEFFKTEDDGDYIRVQWFYRAQDTVMKGEASFHDKKRLFISDLMNDNFLDCIVSKVKISQVAPSVNLKSVPHSDFYYDMKYSVEYTAFCNIKGDNTNLQSPTSLKRDCVNGTTLKIEESPNHKLPKVELALLDVYSGCGGMSTGLCLGAKLSGIDLVTKWAVDADEHACESMRHNHPETQIRNEPAEDFLDLLKEWDKLCKQYLVNDGPNNSRTPRASSPDESSSKVTDATRSDEFEVEKLVDICHGDPNEVGKRKLHFKVRWAGYGPSEDTWEPVQGLSKCQDKIRDFVNKCYRTKLLPRPGDVDVICGGPPCQGISGYNRHRNVDDPLSDEKNRQIVIFMDIVNFLKPKYLLMENVADILRFANGTLGRYAFSRLIHMKYQTRLGIMAAGCYGLPQFRLRVFLWGAHPDEKLPQFPLPTHDVILKYGAPTEFERCIVAYDEGQVPDLEKPLVLRDAISDLPPVTNRETRQEMYCRNPPETDFQKFIRADEYQMKGITLNTLKKKEKHILYDHQPLPLSELDMERVSRIPKRKGANFRDLPGVIVGSDNVARRDPKTEIVLPCGRPLVPDYAFNFSQGKSTKPFGRLWWDETVSTVLCTLEYHSQAVLHPEQDRTLTIRECARLQGFPDYYRFCGGVEDRYCQIGNAVAVPVSRALGYMLGLAIQKLGDDKPLATLPPKFSHSTNAELLQSSSFFS